MDSPGEAAIVLRELRDFGVKIYLDDFGTGYSSLSHLHKLPVDALKIDRSFVNSLLLPDRPAIVESILALARTLKTSVVAEGIESEVQARELERLGCTHAQGFLFSRPLSHAGGRGAHRAPTVRSARRASPPRRPHRDPRLSCPLVRVSKRTAVHLRATRCGVDKPSSELWQTWARLATPGELAAFAESRAKAGGEEGIRTPGSLSTSTVFKTAALNHSATSPHQNYSDLGDAAPEPVY